MWNSIAHGRRNAVRVVLFQLGIAGLVGLGFCARDGRSGLAAWCGGSVIAIGSALFAWRLYADGIASTRRIARAMYAAEVLKWSWVVFALYLALAVLRLEPLPLIVSVIAAQLAFWMAAGIFR
jgi:F0F1-type ATP synthase assembly protein I